jgi:hypothetical protein
VKLLLQPFSVRYCHSLAPSSATLNILRPSSGSTMMVSTLVNRQQTPAIDRDIEAFIVAPNALSRQKLPPREVALHGRLAAYGKQSSIRLAFRERAGVTHK